MPTPCDRVFGNYRGTRRCPSRIRLLCSDRYAHSVQAASSLRVSREVLGRGKARKLLGLFPLAQLILEPRKAPERAELSTRPFAPRKSELAFTIETPLHDAFAVCSSARAATLKWPR